MDNKLAILSFLAKKLTKNGKVYKFCIFLDTYVSKKKQ